jgi:hypothetical protein
MDRLLRNIFKGSLMSREFWFIMDKQASGFVDFMQWRTQEFFFGGGGGGSTNSVEDRGQRERGSGGGSPLVRGSAQFAIQFNFDKLSGCQVLLRMYFPRNWEFGSALSKLRNVAGV